MELGNKIVVITGAGSGIGRALAQRFKREGTRGLMLADINGDAVRAVADVLDAQWMAADVAREAEIAALVERTETSLGPIDLFCSNAGVALPCDLSTGDDAWRRSWEINVMAHVYAARAVVPRMVARGGGYLLNTASAAGLLNQIGSAAYGVSKHAAVGFGEWLAISYAHQGIKVSMLCPQAVRTAMTDNTGDGTKAASVDGMLEPEAVADAVVDGLRREQFLILPHPQVRDYMQRKVADYDRWLAGMNRLHRKITGLSVG